MNTLVYLLTVEENKKNFILDVEGTSETISILFND